MARIECLPRDQDRYKTQSFWDSWLHFLLDLNYRYFKETGNSRGIQPEDEDSDIHAPFDEILDTTKALLVHGAKVNYHLSLKRNSVQIFLFGRRGLRRERYNLVLSYSAFYTLKECFGNEPEFRKFFATKESLATTPTREIIVICKSSESASISFPIRPDAEEGETLWRLIEKWERTGRREDLIMLQSAIEAISRPNKPKKSSARITYVSTGGEAHGSDRGRLSDDSDRVDDENDDSPREEESEDIGSVDGSVS
ncbi:MAG: hypothetical protein Q9207_005715 [Kuettlingeria erythrocarpa]